MKITRLEIKVHEMQLSDPYEIFYEYVDKCVNIFIRAETDTGITGYGCAAPDKMVTGESIQSVINDFNSVIEPILKNEDPFRYGYLLEELKHKLTSSPSTLAMADMLLLDMVGKKAGEPLYRYLGGYRTCMPTSITIGIMPVKDTIEKAKDFVARGFYILKLKGGKDVENDIEKVIRLRESLGDTVRIRFDANQGYDLGNATHFCEATRYCSIELLEQPTPREYGELLGMVSRKVAIPIMADESIMNLRDAFRFTTNDFADMINIKLMKAGGIREAFHIDSLASAAGMETMIGCMDESGLAIAAGLHFALSRTNVIYADLDGHFDLQDDPAHDAVILREGVLYPTGKPGLGFNMDKFFK